MSRLIGGSALRARLENVKAVSADFAAEWADQTITEIEKTKPHSERPESSRFTEKVTRLKAGIYGAYWWIFVDRGTKAHGPKKAQALVFTKGNETIFARHVKGMRRRPFISAAAQHALTGSRFKDMVVQSWNGRRRRSKKAFL